jgi:hypothetical protein
MDSILIECGEVQVAQDAAHDWAVRGVEVANVVQETQPMPGVGLPTM